MRIGHFILLSGLIINYSLINAQVDSSITNSIDEWIVFANSTTDKEQSLQFAYKALELSTQSDYPTGVFNSYSVISRTNYDNGNYQDAIRNASRAFRVYNKNDHLKLDLEFVNITMSLALTEIGAYSDAIKHRKNVLKYQLSDSTINTRKYVVFYSLNNLGMLFMKLEMYDSSLVYFNKARIFANQEDSLKYKGDNLNNIGLVYHVKGIQDSAIIFYQTAISHFSKIEYPTKSDSFMIALIKGNMAECLPNYDPRKEQYFLEDIKGSIKYENYGNVINTYIKYAVFLMDKKRFIEADTILIKAERLASSKNCINNETYIKLYNVIVQNYIHSGKRKLALAYHKKLQKLINEVYGKKAGEMLLEIHSSYKLSKIEDELDLEMIRGEKNVAQIEALNKKNELYSTYIIIVILLVVLLAVIIFKIRGDAKKKGKEKEMKNKLLKLELAYNIDRLNNSIIGLTRKREFAEELMKRLSLLDSLPTSEKNSLKIFVHNELEIDNSILNIEKNVKMVGEEFISQLKFKYPILSESDLKLLGFIKMKLTNKQIAEIKNVSPLSVKTAKNRLRKKLSMSPGSDFIENLSL